MNNAAERLGRELKLIRVGLGLKSKDVCEAASITAPTLTQIEAGKNDTRIGKLAAVAEVLGYEITLTKK